MQSSHDASAPYGALKSALEMRARLRSQLDVCEKFIALFEEPDFMAAVSPGSEPVMRVEDDDINRHPGLGKVRDVIRSICRQRNVSESAVLGKGRAKGTVEARDGVIRELSDRFPHYSVALIARAFARDHTTILHSLKKTKKPGQAR